MSGVVLITGASRGIGAATAVLAAEAGYDVAVNYRNDKAAAEDVVARITARGRRALAIQGDVAVDTEIATLFRTVDNELGPLNVLVNNAGTIGRSSRLEDMDAARIRRVLDVNVVGAFLCAGEAIRRMSTRHGGRGGSIVNVSSAAARLGSPNEFIDYAASKGALDTMTFGLSKEVADDGIRVNAVRPGLIVTDIHATAGMPDRLERLVGGVPLKRAGEAAEVAGAILWLMSDKASYVTGITLDISGGR